MRLGVNRRSTFTPDLEWAAGVGQFQAAVLTGVRALFLFVAVGAQVAERRV